MLKYYRFQWEFGPNFGVSGLFVASDRKVANAIGKELDFGEVLGKNFLVKGPLKAEDLTVLSEDQDFIKQTLQVLPDGFGYNPLKYRSRKASGRG